VDLVHCIAPELPDHVVNRDQEHAWQVLDKLAGRAIAGQEVLRLDVPD
jgi:hypothetical protein